MCFSLLELSILYLLHSASKLLEDPGNLSLAKTTVSIISFLIKSLPTILSSLFKCDKSNSRKRSILRNFIKKILTKKIFF